MHIRGGRHAVVAVAVTVVGVVVMYLILTRGVAAWNLSRGVSDSGSVALPSVVENAPPSVSTTSSSGPVGEVSMVYAGTDVDDGLVGELEHPWLAVAARSGAYRAIDAPALPEAAPGGVAVSDGGDRLAWATGDGVEIYDPVTDEAREIPLAGASRVGKWSPAGDLLVVHAAGLRILDVASGEVLAGVDGTEESAALQAAWRPDGSAVDFVDDEDLVTLPADGGRPTTQPTSFSPSASLAWAPSGEELVGVQEIDGLNRMLAAPVADGELGQARRVDTSGISLNRLLGYSGQRTVAVSAYFLESGAVERVIDIPLDGGSASDVTVLPQSGENWAGTETMAASGAALRAGSIDYDDQLWPWSHLARLSSCALVGFFLLGLWLTRRPRARRRAGR